MKNTANQTTRRNVIQQMALVTASLGIFSFAGKTGEILQGGKKGKKLSPFYIPPAAPLQPGPAGLDIRTWVRSSSTNGQFSTIEAAVAPKQMGPAPHVHKELDELMYVLEGTASVIVAGKVDTIPAGGFHFRPHGLEHTFWNASDKPLRFLDMYFNQNFEDFLEELFHQIFPDMAKANLTPNDPAIAKRLLDLDKRFGVTTFPEKRQAIIDKYSLRG